VLTQNVGVFTMILRGKDRQKNWRIDIMLCPLLMIGKDMNREVDTEKCNCLEDSCDWFITQQHSCAVWVIANIMEKQQ
jgi:hypothetical protein